VGPGRSTRRFSKRWRAWGWASASRGSLRFREVRLVPGDVRDLLTAPALHQRQAFRERHALTAVGTHGVLGHAGKPGRVFGTGHDRPAPGGRGRLCSTKLAELAERAEPVVCSLWACRRRDRPVTAVGLDAGWTGR